MLISHFNRIFARHGKWLLVLLTALIAGSMVLFVTPGSRGGGGDGRNDKTLVGEIYGRKLEREEFFEYLYAADISIYLRWGQLPSQSNDRRMFGFLINETLKRIRALREAETRGLLAVADKEVAEAVRDARVFQGAQGTFDREKFNEFNENILRRREIDGRRFDQIVRENLAIDRLEDQVRAAVFVSPNEVKDAFKRENEKFKVQYREFTLNDFREDVATGVLEADVEAYYEKNKAELKLPVEKRIRVAVFAADAFAQKEVVTEKEARQQFERARKHLYDPKKRTFADVQDEIVQQLRRNKGRRQATEKSRKLCSDLAAQLGKSGEQAPAAVFSTVCKKLGVSVKDSGRFHGDSKEIPDIGPSVRLRQEGYALTPEAPFTTNAIYDGGDYYVASLLEELPAETPTELTDWVRKDIRDRILNGKAEAYFEERVADYRKAIAAGDDVAAIKDAEAKEIDALTDKSDDEKAELKAATERAIDAFLVRYLVPAQRKAAVASFSPSRYRTQVKLSEEDMKSYYDSHADVYKQPEVKVREIVLRVPARATAEQKKAKHEEMAGILAELKGGANFATIARQKSQDPLSKRRGGDAGFWRRGQKEKVLEDAAFALGKGATSGIIESSTGLHIIQENGRRDGRPFAVVKSEIKNRLTSEKAKELSAEAVKAFTEAVKAKLPKDGTIEASVAVFKQVADDQKVPLKETELFGASGPIVPLGPEPALSEAVFALSSKSAVTGAVAGKRSTFVACLVETVAPHVPTFAQDSGLATKVREQMRTEESRAFYTEKVEAYREQVTAGETPEDLKQEHEEQVRGIEELTDEERAQRIKEYERCIDDYLRPYFVPTQKKARVVTFAPTAFRKLASVTDEGIKAHYDENLTKYDREEVRASQITVRVPYDASDEVKSTKRARAEALLARIQGGEDFGAVARSDSEDYSTKSKGGDMGFFGRGDKAVDITAAVFGLDVGEVGSVVETGTAFYLFRLDGRRNGRTVEEVSGEIRAELLDKESSRLAEDAAYEFSEAAYKALDGAGPDANPSAVFQAAAVAAGLSTKDTNWHRGRGSIPPFGFESSLSRDTYGLDETDPLSETIKGKEDFYVACWLDSKTAYLPSFDVEPGLPKRVERHVTREQALQAAAEEGRRIHAEIASKLAEGVSATDALAGYEFKESDEFTTSRPPTGVPNRDEVAAEVSEHSVGALLDVLEGRTGATLVLVSARVPATDEEFEDGKGRFEGKVQRTKEGERLRAFYKRLEDESGTVLEEEWQTGS